MNWIIENQEWIFSGIGITILSVIIGLLKKFFSKNTSTETETSAENQTINIKQNNKGKNSNQIGIQNNYYGENKK